MNLRVLLVVAFAFGKIEAVPSQRSGNHYVRVEAVDATCKGSDLHHGGTSQVGKLKTLCDADDACLGFHSRGMLKKVVSVGCQDNDLSTDGALFIKTDKEPEASPLPVVPLPKDFTYGFRAAHLTSEFAFLYKVPSDAVKDFMEAASREYFELIITHHGGPTNVTTGLAGMEIIVVSSDMSLGMSTDESYQLSIPSSGMATLTANTVYGARHALETFSQLVRFDLESHMYEIANTPIDVSDEPRFAHRGMLLDTSRHYHSLPIIKRWIRSLSHAKLNVFHWHIVDNQAFPLQMRSLPNIVKGAYTPEETYTPEDVADVVAYAKRYGIRVIPEFDTPGHASAWCAGYPEICPSSTCTQPLNPATNATFGVISTLMDECKGLFPDSYFHLGGDEVNTACWSSTTSIREWMGERNFSVDDTYKYFVAVTHALARSKGRKSIHWEEVFNHFGGELDKDTIFQVWLTHATAAKIVASGYQCILSNQDVWYLDHLKITWQQFYTNDPYMGITDPKQQKLVLGGETCMWGETVDDSDLFNTVWPRAAAAAERLWSEASVVDTAAFEPRLAAFRCLLTRRGIGAAPLNVTEGRMPPPHPGSCFKQ